MQNLLLIDDDEIYNDDEDDFSFLPPLSNDDDSTVASNTNRIQYVNTVRKTRPLPKIPERSSSKGTSTEKKDGLKNQNKLTARQLFEMLSDDRIIDTDNISTEKEDEILYGGVYAFKTQLPSPHLSNKSIQHASYQYENFNTNYYKMMTPVQEVEEDQLYNYEEDTSYQDNDYNTATTTSTTDRPLSEASFNAPSLTSGRTSPSSHKSHQSIDSLNQKSDHEHAVYLDGPEININRSEEDKSLVSDVERLAELNQALMTPVISNQNIVINRSPPAPAPALAPVSEDYSNINTASPQAMTSFSLTNNKESIKTYRRMATKTHDKNIQFTYAKYLMQLVSFHGAEQETNSTRDRLQEEVEYWIEKLAKANYAEALYIKGQWHSHCCDRSVINIFVGSQYKKVNHAKAFKCFQQAAKLGSTEAHYELAEYWKDRKEYKKALSSYKFAASKNHILALYVSVK
ncbi:MAG: sel1 repeat family protein [Paenibacillus sp.]|nr:sel1 repeat family protein [Paenibacillus sp.]